MTNYREVLRLNSLGFNKVEICDRIVHDSYTIVIDCKDSMRKRKGISEN